MRRPLVLVYLFLCLKGSVAKDPPSFDATPADYPFASPLLLPQFPCGAAVVSLVGADVEANPEHRDRALQLVLKYGKGPLAYSALEPGIQYFFAHGGVIPYASRFGVNFILEGPIGPAGSERKLLEQFITANPETYVCAASEDTAEIVTSQPIGHYANQMGEVVDLDLGTYSLEGSDRASMRRGYHRLLRSYDIVESDWNGFTSEEIIGVSERWREVSGARTSLGWKAPSQPHQQLAPEKELGFLARPLRIHEEEPGVRKFFVVTKAEPKTLVAYYIFDPMYHEGEVVGYHLNFKRRSPDADKKTEEAVVMHVTKLFQEESKKRLLEGRPGIQVLSMGLLPLFNITDDRFPHSLSLSFVFRTFERASRYPLVARNTFNFFGHGQFKSRFDGIHRKIYFTTPHEWNARPVLGLMALCNVRIWGVSPVLEWFYGGNSKEKSQ